MESVRGRTLHAGHLNGATKSTWCTRLPWWCALWRDVTKCVVWELHTAEKQRERPVKSDQTKSERQTRYAPNSCKTESDSKDAAREIPALIRCNFSICTLSNPGAPKWSPAVAWLAQLVRAPVSYSLV